MNGATWIVLFATLVVACVVAVGLWLVMAYVMTAFPVPA